MASPPPDGGGWTLVPYINASGRSQILEFLDGLRRQDFDRYAFFREQLWPLFESRGPFGVGGGYWEPVGGGLGEIRFGRYRVYCSLQGRRCIMMYMGVLKLWPKFRRDHRKFCERSRADVESAAYDQEEREYLYAARETREKKTNG